MTDLRYPIEPLQLLRKMTADDRTSTMTALETTPVSFRRAAPGLSEKQVDTLRRPGGWTLRRLTHHLPDGHVNGYVRMRTALTRHRPTVRMYNEDSWSRSEDYRTTPPEISRSLLQVVHHRRTILLQAASITNWSQTGIDSGVGEITLAGLVALCAWRGEHHRAHVTALG